MFRTYKRKLNLTAVQEQRVRSWIGACRVVYNLALQIKQDAYRKTGKSPSAYDLNKQLPELRKAYEWIEDVPAQVLQAAVFRLEDAYKRFFKGGGFPKWASKKTYHSIVFSSWTKVDGDKICFLKLGWVNMFKDALIEGTIKTTTIKLEPTGLFAYIVCELPDAALADETRAVGIDMGLAHFAILSDGTFIENPRHFAKYERQLRVEMRSLSRKKQGSNCWIKQAKRVALLQHKIANVRKDFLHKTSTAIAKQYGTVCVEDLNIPSMVRNGRLSKHIMDAGWGAFRYMLEYKSRVVKVDPKYTSQTCNACGEKDKLSRTSQSKFKCTACGYELHADYNAALNILDRGIAILANNSPIS